MADASTSIHLLGKYLIFLSTEEEYIKLCQFLNISPDTSLLNIIKVYRSLFLYNDNNVLKTQVRKDDLPAEVCAYYPLIKANIFLDNISVDELYILKIQDDIVNILRQHSARNEDSGLKSSEIMAILTKGDGKFSLKMIKIALERPSNRIYKYLNYYFSPVNMPVTEPKRDETIEIGKISDIIALDDQI